MTIRQLIQKYDKCSYAKLRDIIISNTTESEEAIYYLLRYKLEKEMSYIYSRFVLKDELGDVMMDFQLYLRNGKADKNLKPYQGLNGIMSVIAFKAWIKRTFRNFLVDRCEREAIEEINRKAYGFEAINSLHEDKEEQIRNVCNLIACMIQNSLPDDLFLFYRHLLHTMCKTDVIPSEKISMAMGISHGTYRTRASRINRKFAHYKSMLTQGQQLPLTASSIDLAEKMVAEFDDLTSFIKNLYESNLREMTSCQRIEKERAKDFEQKKMEMPKYDSGIRFSIKAKESLFFENVTVDFSRFNVKEIQNDSEENVSFDYLDLCPRQKALKLFKDIYLS